MQITTRYQVSDDKKFIIDIKRTVIQIFIFQYAFENAIAINKLVTGA